MARDRQRAKRRQAERREARLRQRSEAAAARGDGTPEPQRPAPEAAERADGDAAGPGAAAVTDPVAEAQLAAGAPPQEIGRSDTVVEAPPPAPQLEEPDRPAGGPAEKERRSRVVSFLVAVWAELQRVQWPDRKSLTTLTGVVLGFVLVAGGYLGGLDAIFSRLIQAIL